jgi:type I restriction enzyme, S subunit
VVGRKGNVGSVFWVDRDFWPIDTVYFVAPESVSLFGYHILSAQSFENSDAAVPGLNRDYAHGKELKWPPANLRASYEDVVKPIFAQRRTLIVTNARLRTARDILLPRLMDGRIEV